MDRWRLWYLATGDEQVIANCGPHTQRLFSWTGLVVGIMVFLTPLSLHQLFNEAFNSVWMAWTCSIIFSLVLMNIYRMILATVGRNVLPMPGKAGVPYMSLLIRLVVLCGFAAFLAAPLCTLVFKESGEVFVHTAQDNAVDQMKTLRRKFIGDPDTVRALDMKIAQIGSDRFFIERIRETYAHEPWAYAVTGVIMGLFMLPVFLKRTAFGQSDHLQAMRELEVDLILDEYGLYNQAWQANELEQGLVMFRHIRFDDPPFNTRLKPKPSQEDWKAFTKWYTSR